MSFKSVNCFRFLFKFKILLYISFFLGLNNQLIARIDGESALSHNFPRVALSVKEQYVDPMRINPDAMLASILEYLELSISRLVVTMPDSLLESLEKSKKGEGIKEINSLNTIARAKTNKNSAESSSLKKIIKEKIILDFGGVKKVIDYEPTKSIYGMYFKLRDFFKFLEAEAKKQKESIDWEKIESGVINAMLSTLDPHSVYLEPKYARDLTLTTKGEFGGVGIVISIRDGFLTVISPIEGTPAAKAGVKAKDRIVKIDEDSAINMPLEDAVTKLRGAPNSTVKITVQRANSPKEIDFSLKRSVIKVDSVSYALLENGVGYLRIKAFQGNTATDVKSAILDMKNKSKGKMKGLILDMRDNPGGLLREAITISDLFLSGGEIVSTQGALRESRQVEMATPGEVDPSLKLAALINGGSASASEIVGAAIKYGGTSSDPEEGRGILIGDAPTFGKGSVQMLFEFPDLETKANNELKPVQPAALKLTIAQYYAPKGRIIQTIGIKPDILLTPVNTQKSEDLSLFENISRREVDLDAHLSVDKDQDEKSLIELSFLAPQADNDLAADYGKLDTAKLKNDFAIRVALAFLNKSSGPSRKELLAHSDSIKNDFEKEEQKKITNALKKFNIDWSEGKALTNKNALVATLKTKVEGVSGDKLKLSIAIKNTSNQPAYQVHAITHSKTDIFNQRELLFGKLDPKKEIERSIVFDIPKDVVTRKDLLSLEVRDVAKEELSSINIPLSIEGLKRPRLAHMVYIDDQKLGNGDGKVQDQEEVDLLVWLKNIGEGKAYEPTVILKNESGSKVFLKTGREQSGELLPNQETSMRFSFHIKEPTDSADFEIQIFDGQMHDLWRDKISIPIAKKNIPAKKNNEKFVIKEASLYAKPASDSDIRATLKNDATVFGLAEYDDYYFVKIDDNLNGYIRKSAVKKTVKSVSNNNKEKSYSINYKRKPAKINLSYGDNNGFTTKKEGQLVAQLSDAEKVSEVLLFVNGKKVLYKSLVDHKNEDKITQTLTLKPGVNIITLLAREDANYGQRENLTVYYEDQGLVLAEPPKSEPAVKNQSPQAKIP